MVEFGAGEDLEAGAEGAAFGVVGSVDDAGDARLDDGSGAHGAGFEGDVESGAGEPVIVDGLGHFTNGDDFGVGGGVVIADGAIAGAHEDGATVDHDCADGYFAGFGGGLGFGEG